MAQLHNVTAIIHDDEIVYCWNRNEAVDTVRHCLRVHPAEAITVEVVRMTADEYEELDDYEGEC